METLFRDDPESRLILIHSYCGAPQATTEEDEVIIADVNLDMCWQTNMAKTGWSSYRKIECVSIPSEHAFIVLCHICIELVV
eukprot:COSAG02_NODE_5106_length_4624_cov_4.014144_3_plen_82_part_00